MRARLPRAHAPQSINKKHDCDVPLVLMNSFNTHDDTQSLLRKYSGNRVVVECFNQSQYPRIFKESNGPMPKNLDDANGWCVHAAWIATSCWCGCAIA